MNRVLLADSQSRVRFALRVLLERRIGIQVVGEAGDAYEMMTQVEMTAPDILILAWELPGLAEQGLLAPIRHRFPRLPVIALSGRPEALHAAIEAGADAFVSKADPPERLLQAVTRYLCRHPSVDNELQLRTT
ncbi:MAG: response regulator transcription factor [Chloroflexi bacterium]|nr:response regulator transcription factor [Chloroflexota bacterium]